MAITDTKSTVAKPAPKKKGRPEGWEYNKDVALSQLAEARGYLFNVAKKTTHPSVASQAMTAISAVVAAEQELGKQSTL